MEAVYNGMTRKFCPKCGENTDDLYGSRGLCQSCYQDEYDFIDLPDEITVEQCPSCGYTRIGPYWRRLEDDELVFHAIKKHMDDDLDVEVGYRRRDEHTITVDVHLTKTVDGDTLTQTLHTTIILHREDNCTPCDRYYSGYFTSIFQLRGEHTQEALEQLLDEAERKHDEDRRAYISRIDKVKNGYDLYVSKKKLSEHLLRYMQDKYKVVADTSSSLWGEIKGEKVYRKTVLCRITGTK